MSALILPTYLFSFFTKKVICSCTYFQLLRECCRVHSVGVYIYVILSILCVWIVLYRILGPLWLLCKCFINKAGMVKYGVAFVFPPC